MTRKNSNTNSNTSCYIGHAWNLLDRSEQRARWVNIALYKVPFRIRLKKQSSLIIITSDECCKQAFCWRITNWQRICCFLSQNESLKVSGQFGCIWEDPMKSWANENPGSKLDAIWNFSPEWMMNEQQLYRNKIDEFHSKRAPKLWSIFRVQTELCGKINRNAVHFRENFRSDIQKLGKHLPVHQIVDINFSSTWFSVNEHRSKRHKSPINMKYCIHLVEFILPLEICGTFIQTKCSPPAKGTEQQSSHTAATTILRHRAPTHWQALQHTLQHISLYGSYLALKMYILFRLVVFAGHDENTQQTQVLLFATVFHRKKMPSLLAIVNKFGR